jgi:hypothetical protein
MENGDAVNAEVGRVEGQDASDPVERKDPFDPIHRLRRRGDIELKWPASGLIGTPPSTSPKKRYSTSYFQSRGERWGSA